MAIGIVALGLKSLFGGKKPPTKEQVKNMKPPVEMAPQQKSKDTTPVGPTKAPKAKKVAVGPASPLLKKTGIEPIDKSLVNISKSLGNIKSTLNSTTKFNKEKTEDVKTARAKNQRKKAEKKREMSLPLVGGAAAFLGGKAKKGMDGIMNFLMMVAVGSIASFLLKNIEKVIKFVEKVRDKMEEVIKLIDKNIIQPAWNLAKSIVGPIWDAMQKVGILPDFDKEENEIGKYLNDLALEIPILGDLSKDIQTQVRKMKLNLDVTEKDREQARQQQQAPIDRASYQPGASPSTPPSTTGQQPQTTPPTGGGRGQQTQPQTTPPTGGGRGQQTQQQGGTSAPSGKNKDYWTLVAVASREDSDPQAWADIAQSIYNRKASGINFGQKDNTLAGYILGNQQYEPTWKYPYAGSTGTPNKEWDQINDISSAARATGHSEEYLRGVAAAINDPTLQKNAREFVGGRTDFMGGNEVPDFSKGDVRRETGGANNFFGFFVGPGSISYGKTNPSASAIPSFGGSTPPINRPPHQAKITPQTSMMGGAYDTGLVTGPASRIGSGAAYHIDAQIMKSVPWDQKVAMVDQMALGYAARGQQIVFSNDSAGVKHQVWDPNASYEDKLALLKRAFAAHSHSRYSDRNSIDFYALDKGVTDLYHSSGEGAALLTPHIQGGSVSHHSGGGYGNFVEVKDANGKVVFRMGHGDTSVGRRSGTIQMPNRPPNIQSRGVDRSASYDNNRGGTVTLVKVPVPQPTGAGAMMSGNAPVATGGGGGNAYTYLKSWWLTKMYKQ